MPIPEVTTPTEAPSSAKKGKAALIRKLHCDYPELSQADIARRTDTSTANVNQVLKRFNDNVSVESLKDYQENKADIYDLLQSRFLASITKEDVEKAPLLARVTSAAILEDKARTIRGQATQINVSVLLDAVQAIKQMRSGE